MAQVPENNQIAEENLESRRRFLKSSVISAALISTPTVLTVTSKPVWAANCTESAQMSGNLSQNNLNDCYGEGCSPEQWKKHADKWHYDYPTSALFSTIFGIDPFPSGCNPTLWQVIHKDYGTYSVEDHIKKLGFQAVAALQNAATSVKFDWNVTTVKDEVYVAYASGNKVKIETLKTKLYGWNNRGATLCD